MGGKFGEWKVFHSYLQASGLGWEERWGWLEDFVRKGRKDMGNFVLCETDRVLGEREVRYVESRNDL